MREGIEWERTLLSCVCQHFLKNKEHDDDDADEEEEKGTVWEGREGTHRKKYQIQHWFYHAIVL